MSQPYLMHMVRPKRGGRARVVDTLDTDGSEVVEFLLWLSEPRTVPDDISLRWLCTHDADGGDDGDDDEDVDDDDSSIRASGCCEPAEVLAALAWLESYLANAERDSPGVEYWWKRSQGEQPFDREAFIRVFQPEIEELASFCKRASGSRCLIATEYSE